MESRIFHMCDANDDGVIDFKEFMVTLYVISRGPKEKSLEKIFEMFDIDDNGTVSKKELSHIVRYVFRMFFNNQDNSDRELEEELAVQAFHEMDANADGKVTKEEFINACMNHN